MQSSPEDEYESESGVDDESASLPSSSESVDDFDTSDDSDDSGGSPSAAVKRSPSAAKGRRRGDDDDGDARASRAAAAKRETASGEFRIAEALARTATLPLPASTGTAAPCNCTNKRDVWSYDSQRRHCLCRGPRGVRVSRCLLRG